MNLQYNQKELDKICKKKNVSYLGLFGSYAKGDYTPKSDIDLLVSYDNPVSLLKHANTENTLSDFFEKPVDLVLERNIKPRIKPYIMDNIETLYAKR